MLHKRWNDDVGVTPKAYCTQQFAAEPKPPWTKPIVDSKDLVSRRLIGIDNTVNHPVNARQEIRVIVFTFRYFKDHGFWLSDNV